MLNVKEAHIAIQKERLEIIVEVLENPEQGGRKEFGQCISTVKAEMDAKERLSSDHSE